MIFYTIHNSTEDDTVVDWAGTQADARAICKERDSIHSGRPCVWQEQEVPVDKPTLLAFLKANCVGKLIKTVTKNQSTQSPPTSLSTT